MAGAGVEKIFRVDQGLRWGILQGFSQILANEFAGFSGAFAGVSAPTSPAMENDEGALAEVAAMAISPMERCRFIVAGGIPPRRSLT
jgi:hypothetical protein